MHLIALATLASCLVSSVSAFCGSDPGPREQVARQEHEFHAFLRNQTETNVANGNSTLSKRAATVSVFWNIIFDQNNQADGNYA